MGTGHCVSEGALAVAAAVSYLAIRLPPQSPSHPEHGPEHGPTSLRFLLVQK